MEKQLDTCINLLTKAKDLVSSDKPNVDLALEMLESSNNILLEFANLENEEKLAYKEQLIQIQALGQIINQKLAQEKDKLQVQILKNNKMNQAVKGYARG